MVVSLLWMTGGLVAHAQEVSLRLRETSVFAGTPVNFYVIVSGTESARQPRLQPSPDWQTRYVGVTPSSRQGRRSITFTYEAVPLKTGSLLLPGGTVQAGDRELPIEAQTVTVQAPEVTGQMSIKTALSRETCYVGQPVLLTFTWRTSLSLNGIKALDITLPALTSEYFDIREPFDAINPNAPDAIGLPVSNQRVLARFRELESGEKPVMEVHFECILIPRKPSSVALLLPAATLTASYTQPREATFKGSRYPSYFNNDFFDRDLTGDFERYAVSAKPLTLQIQPLPKPGKPAGFEGPSMAFAVEASAEPSTIALNQPLALTLDLQGGPFTHLLELPDLARQAALAQSFAIDGEPERIPLAAGALRYRLLLRPLRPSVRAVPSLSFPFFDPKSETYAEALTRPIPIEVRPGESLTVFDLRFADGTRLKNEVLPEPGGIRHNVTGPALLAPATPPSQLIPPHWRLVTLGIPPLLFGLVFWRSRTYRRIRHDPEALQRFRAWRHFRRNLRRLPPDASPEELASPVRTYLDERFGLPAFACTPAALQRLAQDHDIDPDTAAELEAFLTESQATAFSRKSGGAPEMTKRPLLDLLGRFEKAASRSLLPILLLSAALLAPQPTQAGTGPQSLLDEAGALFLAATEEALVDPLKAENLFRLAAARYDSLIQDHGIENGWLHYNLGNCYFLAGDHGRAILHYRRAQLFLPTSDRIREALYHARSERVDFFPYAAPRQTVKALLFWHFYLDAAQRFWIAAVAFALIWLVFAIALFRPLHARWRVVATLAVVIFLMIESSKVHARHDLRRDAVVIAPELPAYKGDAHIYDPALSTPLHSGTEVRILEQRRNWLRIRVEDGSEGWVEASGLERVQ